MQKSEVRKIEKKAKMLMIIDNRIWSRYGWRSGGEVNRSRYLYALERELKRRNITRLDGIYYLILEDANYHTLNNILSDLKMFKGEYPYGAEARYDDYRKSGGRTWKL